MYRDTDYLNYTDLNSIEERIKELTTKLQIYNPSTPNFSLKEWHANDFPYIQEIDRIERGIDNLQKYYYKPNEWQECKIWLTGTETSQIIKSFSYLDINRWINNYSLMKNIFSGYKFEKLNGTKIKINSLINQKAKSLTIEGKSEQNGTPTPDTPVEIKNIDGIRNLFNKNGDFNFGNTRYQTTLEENGTIKSIANYGTGRSAGQKITVKKNTDYNLSGILISATGTRDTNAIVEIMGYENNSSKVIGTLIISKDVIKPYNFSLKFNSRTYEEIWVSLSGWNSTPAGFTETIFDNIMLKEGTSLHDYVPYGSNYLPIVNTGKNKFDGEYELGTINFNTGQLETNTNIIRTKNYQTIIENENYSLSLPLEVTGIILYYYKNGVFVKANQPVINNHSVSFTAPSNANQLKWRFNSGYTTLDNETQLEEGNATNYEPYRKQTTLIDLKGNELCSIGDVKDELSIKNGKAKIIKRIGKVILNGSETLSKLSDGKFRVTSITGIFKNYGYNTTNQCLSNYFKCYANYGGYTTGQCYVWSNAIYFGLDTSVTTIEEAKTWLSSNNPTFYGVLETPQEIELDDYDIELFDGVNNISLDDDLDTNMECEYIKEVGDYTTIWNLQSFMNWNESSDLEWSDE